MKIVKVTLSLELEGAEATTETVTNVLGSPTRQIAARPPQIDNGTVDVYGMAAGGGQGPGLGCAHKMYFMDREYWVLGQGVPFPMTQSIHVLRKVPDPLLNQTDENVIRQTLTNCAAQKGINNPTTHRLDITTAPGDNNRGGHEASFDIYQIVGGTRGGYKGCWNIRENGDGTFRETLALDANESFPIQFDFEAEYLQPDPFLNVNDPLPNRQPLINSMIQRAQNMVPGGSFRPHRANLVINIV